MEKIIHYNRLINTVGLDTDVIIDLIDNLNQFSLIKPRIFNNNNVLFINYKLFSELVGYFMYNKKLTKELAIRKIFSYLRKK